MNSGGLSRDSGFLTIPAQDVDGPHGPYRLMQYLSDCADGEVATFFIAPVALGDSTDNETDSQLICQVDWQFRKGVSSIAFDVLQGVTIRVACNIADFSVLYMGVGPAYTVSAARTDGVTTASNLQLSQRVLLAQHGTSGFLPVPPFAKTVRMISTSSPRSLTLSFYPASLVSGAISSEVVTDASEQPIPNGAQYMTVADNTGVTNQMVTVIASLQL